MRYGIPKAWVHSGARGRGERLGRTRPPRPPQPWRSGCGLTMPPQVSGPLGPRRKIAATLKQWRDESGKSLNDVWQVHAHLDFEAFPFGERRR